MNSCYYFAIFVKIKVVILNNTFYTMRLKRVLSAVLLLFIAVAVQAQTVGVVLSGGGAKGLYHIGVLEALEENGVPIDYIAGTSMGAIIGGLYAAGYSPEEMRAIVNDKRVVDIASGRTGQKYMSYFQRAKSLPSFVNVRVNLKDSTRSTSIIPRNLISSSLVDLKFTELFAPATAASSGDFDNLMIPFFCVASDMEAGHEVVLRKGSLERSIRASMSLPMIYPPVVIDSMVLLDGGIYDNFPWTHMEEIYKPDIIIGVICTGEEGSPDVDSDIMEQAFMISMRKTNYDMTEGNITIERDVDISLLEFSNPNAIIELGYDDAIAQMPQIKQDIAVDRDSMYYANRRGDFKIKSPALIFNEYELSGLDSAKRQYLRKLLKISRSNPKLNRQMGIAEYTNNVYSALGEGNISMGFPTATYDSLSHRYKLETDFGLKANLRMTVGGNLSSTAFNQVYVGAEYESIGYAYKSLFAEMYLGPVYTWGTFGGQSDFYIARTPLSADLTLNFEHKNLRHGNFGVLSSVTDAVSAKNTSGYGSAGISMPIGFDAQFGIRMNAGRTSYTYNTESVASIEPTDKSSMNFIGVKMEYDRSTLNKMLFPDMGSRLMISGIYVDSSHKFTSGDPLVNLPSDEISWWGARIKWDKYFNLPAVNWLSLGLNFDGVWTDQPELSSETATMLIRPSYSPIAHTNMVLRPELQAKRFIAGGIIPTFKIFPALHFRAGAYILYRDSYSGVEVANSAPDFDGQTHYITEATLVYHSRVGPVSLSATKYGVENWDNLYMMFNFGYTIFANKGIFY